jgi:hypothetical protein
VTDSTMHDAGPQAMPDVGFFDHMKMIAEQEVFSTPLLSGPDINSLPHGIDALPSPVHKHNCRPMTDTNNLWHSLVVFFAQVMRGATVESHGSSCPPGCSCNPGSDFQAGLAALQKRPSKRGPSSKRTIAPANGGSAVADAGKGFGPLAEFASGAGSPSGRGGEGGGREGGDELSGATLAALGVSRSGSWGVAVGVSASAASGTRTASQGAEPSSGAHNPRPGLTAGRTKSSEWGSDRLGGSGGGSGTPTGKRSSVNQEFAKRYAQTEGASHLGGDAVRGQPPTQVLRSKKIKEEGRREEGDGSFGRGKSSANGDGAVRGGADGEQDDHSRDSILAVSPSR